MMGLENLLIQQQQQQQQQKQQQIDMAQFSILVTHCHQIAVFLEHNIKDKMVIRVHMQPCVNQMCLSPVI